MANGYVENVEKWKTLTDIDYFTYFIKAWISFNAWYKSSFTNINKDREAINKIKNESNTLRSKALGLISADNEQSDVFKAHLASLHKSLLDLEVCNDGKRLSFYCFIDGVDRNNLIQNNTVSKIDYYLKVEINGAKVVNIKATVKNSNKKTILNYSHTEYDEFHLSNFKDFQNLSKSQKNQLLSLFKQANPLKEESVVAEPSSSDCIQIGSYSFINDREKIFKCLIEIIYGLRNALFHGEIVPNKEHRKVYQHAYHILKVLLDSLE